MDVTLITAIGYTPPDRHLLIFETVEYLHVHVWPWHFKTSLSQWFGTTWINSIVFPLWHLKLIVLLMNWMKLILY